MAKWLRKNGYTILKIKPGTTSNLVATWQKMRTIDGHQLGNDGKWHKESKTSSDYYQVLPVTANIYNADGEKLSYISQGSVVWLDKDRKVDDKRLAILFLVCQGPYMKTEDLQALRC